MKRLFYIDVARAVAILMVTGYHLWVFTGAPDFSIGPFNLYGLLAHGYVGVDLFFVVSGFMMRATWGRQDGDFLTRSTGFLKSRAARLMPSYLVAIVVWVAIIRLTGEVMKPTGAWDIATHVLFLHTLSQDTFFSISGVMWSLAVEVHFYVLFPLIVTASNKTRLHLGWLSLAAAFLISATTQTDNVVLRWNVVTFLPLFLLGMGLYDFKDRRWASNGTAFAIMLALASALMLLIPKTLGLDIMLRLTLGAMLGIAFVGFSPFRRGVGLLASVITTIGTASYSIYLYNYIFAVLGPMRIPGLPGIAVYSVFVLGFGVLAWFLFDRQFEAARHLFTRKRKQGSATIENRG